MALGLEKMDSTTKNIADGCAVGASALSYFVDNAPQIAALLSAIWLALRIVEWCWRAYNGFKIKGTE